MADEQFLARVLAVISAARAFLGSDAMYGLDNPRTREAKELLAQAMAALMPDDVDIPELHVIRGDLGDHQVRRVSWRLYPLAPEDRVIDAWG